MKTSRKRFFTSLSIVTLLAPVLLSSVEVFAEDYSMNGTNEILTEMTNQPKDAFTQLGPDLEATLKTAPEQEVLAPIQQDEKTAPLDTSNEGTVIESTEIQESITDESTREPQDSTTEITMDSTSNPGSEGTQDTTTDMTTNDSSTENSQSSTNDSTDATSDGATEDQPENDWTGGIGLDDLEIDEIKEATITLTAVDFIKNENNSNFVKTTEDGLLSVKLNTNYHLSSYLGYDREEDALYASVDAFIDLADPTSGRLYSFSSNPGHIYVWDLGNEDSQTFYFKDKKGKVTEYTLTIKIEEEPVISTQDFEMSEKSSGKVVSTPDKLLEITPNYEKFNWQINTTDDQWKILNYNPENYQISKAYEKRTYNIVLYSEKLQKVNIYKFKVDRMISGSDLVDHTIDLKLSKNNQYRFANEFYQTYDDLIPGLSISAYFEYGRYVIETRLETSNGNSYYEGLYYSNDEKDRSYTSYLEFHWWEERYDENGDWQYDDKQARIQLNIQLDNTTAVDEDQELQFHYEVDYNDLVIDSKDGTPKEVLLNYASPSNYTETFGIAYLNTNDFDEGKDTNYQGEYVEFYKGDSYVNVLDESSPGIVQASSYHGNSITFTILNAPETSVEDVAVNVGIHNDWENEVMVSPESDNNLKISAYRDYDNTYSLSYDYDYNGIHYYEVVEDWDYSVPGDIGTVNKTIYKRRSHSGKIIAIYNIQFNLEKIEYELQEPLYLSIPKKLGFNRVYAETPDGQVVIVGEYFLGKYADGSKASMFSAHARATEKGVQNQIALNFDGYYFDSERSPQPETDPFLYTVSPKGEFKKYPVIITPDADALEPTVREYYTFDIQATAQELSNVDEDGRIGKVFELEYSEYESIFAHVFIDKETGEPVLLASGFLPELEKINTHQYTTKDHQFIYNLTITDWEVQDILPKKLSLSDSKVTISAGETATISATITPEDATNKSVTWTSSDETVATVVNGVIIGVKEGKATITAETVNGLKKSVKVTVKKAPEKPIIKEELKDESGSGISVSAPEGVLPKGAELKVEPIQTKNEVHQKLDELTEGKFALFDIKLHNSEFGQNVQPNGTVTVRVPIPSGFDPAKIRMYRFDERTGKRTALNGWVDGAYYVFETDQFSYYALVEEEPSVSKEALSELIEKGQDLNGTHYTTESWNLFMEKLRVAKTVLGNDAASDYDVKRAIDELTAGMEALVKHSDSNHTIDDTNNNAGTNNPTNNNQQKPSEHDKATDKKEATTPKGKDNDLPQLGESTSYTLLILGLSLVSLTALIFFKRRKLS